jgi:hypothetical protein
MFRPDFGSVLGCISEFSATVFALRVAAADRRQCGPLRLLDFRGRFRWRFCRVGLRSIAGRNGQARIVGDLQAGAVPRAAGWQMICPDVVRRAGRARAHPAGMLY